MTRTEFADKYQITEEAVDKMLNMEILAESLRGHVSGSGADVSIDEDGEWVLARYIPYLLDEDAQAQSYEMKRKTEFSKRAMIAIVIAVFVYYMTAFALQVAGVISKLTMSLMILPVTAILIIVYLVFVRKKD